MFTWFKLSTLIKISSLKSLNPCLKNHEKTRRFFENKLLIVKTYDSSQGG